MKLNHVDPPAEVVLPKDAKRGVLVVLGSDDSGVANKKFNFHAEADDGPIVPRLKELGFADLPERTVRGPDGYVYYRYLYLDAQGLATALARFVAPPQQLTLRNGQRLAGAYLPEATANGGEVRLSLLWELAARPSQTDLERPEPIRSRCRRPWRRTGPEGRRNVAVPGVAGRRVHAYLARGHVADG